MKKPLTHIAPVYPEHCGCKSGIQHTNSSSVDCPKCKANLKPLITFTFPRLVFIEVNGVYEQVQHIDSEMDELSDAYMEPGRQHLAEECVDLMQSCATLLYRLQDREKIDPQAVFEAVKIKNRMRGYEVEFQKEAQP